MRGKDYLTLRSEPANAGRTRAEICERAEDIPSNRTAGATMGDVINARYGRRDMLRGALAATAIGAVLGPMALARRADASETVFKFSEIEHGVDERHHVAPGHRADVLLRWGDPVVPGAPAFDVNNQSASAQAMQFGYNCDFVGLAPLPAGASGADRGLLCVNHEYTNEELMFPGMEGEQESKENAFKKMTRELVAIEMAAHGASVVEIRRGADGRWSYDKESRFNRRITAETPMTVSGPAAGHDRLKTTADPTGTRVLGMVNNCAGGMTPWGTYLTAEENFHFYFWGDAAGSPEERNHKRYAVPGKGYNWGAYHERFDVAKEPNEPNRFGWIVEIDPYDATSTPVKRTALGRMKHEGAEAIVNKDGRVVLYMGDDERFEYVYKFVSTGRYDAANRAANRNLLDDGVLSVARFDADGTMAWLPLVWGTGPLTAANGFASQADVLIEARHAADLLGATKMDRPEDVEASPRTGKVYALMTNNSRRKADQVDAANPRADNNWGHIVEMTPPDQDHAATTGRWEILIKAGDPSVATVGAMFNPATSKNGWFSCPDNCAFDAQGRMWVATDQGEAWKKASGTADGLYAVETEGALRGTSKMFFRVPVGAELCGPCFTGDGRALFLAVQHPASDGAKEYAAFGKNSTFENPATRWPDFQPGMPPRPSVVVVTKDDGGVIAG